MQRVVDDVDAGIGAHLQRLAHGLFGLRRSHAHRHDLAAVGFGQLQRLLYGVFVELIHHAVGGLAVQRLVGVRQFFSAQVSGTCFTQTAIFIPVTSNDPRS